MQVIVPMLLAAIPMAIGFIWGMSIDLEDHYYTYEDGDDNDRR